MPALGDDLVPGYQTSSSTKPLTVFTMTSPSVFEGVVRVPDVGARP